MTDTLASGMVRPHQHDHMTGVTQELIAVPSMDKPLRTGSTTA